MHNKWQTENRNYDADIALITVKNEVSESLYVKPILLPNRTETESLLKITEGFVVGWGRDSSTNRSHETIPKELQLPIQTDSVCLRSNIAYTRITSERTFCAGSQDGKGPCTGDSGSGFFVELKGKFYLRGIVAASLAKDGVCDANNYAVFTDVLMFLNWLLDDGDKKNVPIFSATFPRRVITINEEQKTNSVISEGSKDKNDMMFAVGGIMIAALLYIVCKDCFGFCLKHKKLWCSKSQTLATFIYFMF